MPGVGMTRSFEVAKNCKTATQTTNTITVVQFTSREAFDTGSQTIASTLPRASTLQGYPLVIVATGPDQAANLAAVKPQLPAGVGSLTTTG